MDQGKLTYSLLPESILQYFDVERTTGRVYVKNGDLLDREIRALYSVTLQARDTDGKPGSAILEITVTDINDQTPVPNRGTYQEFVNEGENLENVKIEATDGDEPDTPNSQLVFTIEPGPYSKNFSIDPDTGVFTNNGPLDREAIAPDLNGKIELNVNISDKGVPPLSTVVQVIINVQDVNDHKPEFEKPFYNFTVKEGEKGIMVGSVYAVDQDQAAEFNRISFSIVEGSFGSFIISSVADAPGYLGNIRVDQDVELDYEGERKSFSLQLEARDLLQEKDKVTVEVHVLDVNDERPMFRPIPAVEVKENSKETGPIGKFDAVDKDTNSSLVYELVSVRCRCGGDEKPCDWFVLEPNGEVKINPEATIDYETCVQAIVEAQVVDIYTEKGENNSASPGEMVINIKDMNDNTPEFIYSNSVFAVVSESASQGTSVAKVSATDRDSGINAQITFQVKEVQFIDINGGTPDNKIVFEAITTRQDDIYVGIIQSTEKLNVELKGKYLVTVDATDTGGLTNSTELEIFVIDEGFRNELKFGISLSQMVAKEADIIRDFTICTQAKVQVVRKYEGTPEQARESAISIMVAYFIFGNGTAMKSNTLLIILSDPENMKIMEPYTPYLPFVGTGGAEDPKMSPLWYGLFGMIAGFIVVLTTSLLCTRRKANPVLNLNIDSAIALDLGEDSDVEKVSLDSLDNINDMTVIEKDTQPIMEKTREVDEDRDSGITDHIEPLGAALAQDQKICSKKNLLSDTNPYLTPPTCDWESHIDYLSPKSKHLLLNTGKSLEGVISRAKIN
uniref:Cadherin domain-containing protein n=1 Tax=Neogobius melanostomus TaxID=47308 RepID=A0A8C6TAS7_9GOBI